ncbi:hypothetical protein 2 [Hubei tombus-like virus 29]|uniref:hypothetical protein 2 n=1 Tax=Hubei tombus-like virus 29 TaxID=1923276 RepID=UPI000909DD63|nr:hypothetical protein 2 [Hubei tombus-like virus 29]APG76376.1 hypothetical protein 2 [Hubei tombus-like virus 29]
MNTQLFKYIKKFVVKVEPWTFDEYIASMSSASKRKQYSDYYDQYLRNGRIPSYITPFTKIEKMSSGKYKAPRMIQGRHMVFNLHYGRYIKPLEKEVTKYGKFSIHFGKGNYNQQAEKIFKLSQKYKYYTECDHTSFDAHVTVEQLRLTHRFYNSCFPGYASDVARLAKRTINNTCISRTGDIYRVRGSRMSGDVDTGFGNCLINYAILKAACSNLHIKCEIIVNGDDSIIFTDVPIPTAELSAELRKYNMESKVNPSVSDIHKVEFCRTKLVFNASAKPTMMIDPKRLIDIYGMCYTISKKNYHQYLLETAMCNSYINCNNPLGVLWAKYFNIDLISYKKNEKSKIKILQNIKCLEKDKILKMMSLSPDETTTEEVTPSMLAAWPDIYSIEAQIKKLADRVLNRKYQYKLVERDFHINHDIQFIVKYQA